MGSATTASEVFNRRIPITFNFIEQIDFGKISHLKVVGRGSFGVVYRGRWHDKLVAVKKIMSTENEKATQMEIRQLTRVNHPNIIKLYGHCIDPVCLVMEYAEDGCLHKVLHGLWIEKGEVEYTWAHAMNWALQTASGVAYLHGMRPKAIIHRDLKPANLLLFSGAKIVKIGDFGVARDKATMMTNGQGSASWMAPEVIEGVTYTEKCDVFSWGIILWELLTREKPFNEIGRDTALSIMFAICKGSRPPLDHPTLSSCPSEILTLIETCWAKDPNKRPSMDQVAQKMSSLSQLFPGAEEKLRFSAPPTQQLSLTPAKLAPGKAKFQEMKAKFC